MILNGKEVDKTSLEVDGVDYNDSPEFSDAYFSKGLFADGTEMNDLDLMILTEDYPEVVNEMAFESGHQ
ncbi:hypothetical protein [Flavobacterium sp.]|jgi:hypothetical protein|uniref:hypothetical protein n=1 Tax=Flavobacterium sp. TaxID=239 RepID=UPI0037C10F3A